MLKKRRDLSLPCAVAELMVRNGHGEQGLRWLESVLQQDPSYKPAHALLADYYQSIGDLALAAKHRQLAP